MKLLEELEGTVDHLDSPFQAHLMREDIQRLNKLFSLAEGVSSFEEFEKDGFFLGWTQNDLRTSELAETLEPFLSAFYAAVRGKNPDCTQAEVKQAWVSFNKDRMSKLIGCL